MDKRLPVGVDDYEKLITRNYYFVDKTLLIKDILDVRGDVNLFTRPRRFGKTLNLSMLRYFFEDWRDRAGNPVDEHFLFDGTKIMDCGEKYLEHMGQYPVIQLSLKGAKQPDYAFNPNCFPESYWANTSSNSIVRKLIDVADRDVRDEIELLIAGGTVEKPVHEDITYDEVYKSMDNLWNFMFFTGYFRKESIRMDEKSDNRYLTMRIPNREVRYIFSEKIRGWFDEVKLRDASVLFRALREQDVDTMRREINKILIKTISYFDYAESFYHGFLAGILYGMEDYVVKSNRESGNGRTDLSIRPALYDEPAYLFEFKIAKSFKDLEGRAMEALAQIEEKHYDEELMELGYEQIVRYGVAFFGKNCRVVTHRA